VTALVADGLIQMERLAQDGVKVRASAGAASFRRRPTIVRLRAEVAERIERLRRELDDDPGVAARRRAQIQARVAEEQAERLRRAQVRLSELEAEQARRAKKDRPKGTALIARPVRRSSRGSPRPIWMRG
jgi:hypothetical protein